MAALYAITRHLTGSLQILERTGVQALKCHTQARNSGQVAVGIVTGGEANENARLHYR